MEGLFATRKGGFAEYPTIPKELDLVEKEDQITFELSLDDELDKEEVRCNFKQLKFIDAQVQNCRHLQQGANQCHQSRFASELIT